MEQVVDPGSGSSLGPEPTGMDPQQIGHFPPYPVEKRERAALDLTDAAQADTQAADLDRDEAAESRRLARLTQRLYANADTHQPPRREGPPLGPTFDGDPIGRSGRRSRPASTTPERKLPTVVFRERQG